MTTGEDSQFSQRDSGPVRAPAVDDIVRELASLRNEYRSLQPVLHAKVGAIAAAVEALVAQREVGKAWQWQVPKYRLREIGGLPKGVLAEVDEIVRRCNAETRFAKLRIPWPTGIVLIGPSGVGKTMLAHAIADEVGLDEICVVSGPSLLASLTRFDSLFAEAISHAGSKHKSIVFLDELEVLGEHRRGMRLSGIDSVKHLFLVKLMTQLEELRGNNVLVIGATNRVEMLDPALLRTGRMEKQIYLDLPTAEGRYDVLRRLKDSRHIDVQDQLLQGIAHSAGSDTGTSGFSGADLADLLTEALVQAALKGEHRIDTTALDEAIRRVRVQITRRSANDPEEIFTRTLAPLAPLPPPRLGLARVAGLAHAKARLEVVVEMLSDPKRFRATGCRLPRGVLLSGPPGVGKTLLARALAEQADVPFFHVTGSDFIQTYVGVGAARVRDTFRIARHQSPCILFIDEIDAFGARRGEVGRGDAEHNQTLNQILTELSGIEDDRGVVVIGATNRPALLDRALTRPGRFDYRIEIGLPELSELCAIYDMYRPANDQTSTEMRRRLLNDPRVQTGAAIASVLNTARIQAAISRDNCVRDQHLERALEWMSPTAFEQSGAEDAEDMAY